MGVDRRSRKPRVDYQALSGARKPRSSTSALAARSRAARRAEKASADSIVAKDTDMADGTITTVPDNSLPQDSEADQTFAERYFEACLDEYPNLPVEQVFFLRELMQRNPGILESFYTKGWSVRPDGLLASAQGNLLVFDYNEETGQEFLSDPNNPIFEIPLPPRPVDAEDDTTLDPIAMQVEQLRLSSIPGAAGLFDLTMAEAPVRRVAGGAATLARMRTQKTQVGTVPGTSRTKTAKPNALLPAATIREAPKSGGPSVSRIPTTAEAARQQVRSSATITISESESESESEVEVLDDNDLPPASRPSISSLPEHLQPVVTTACEIFRILVLNVGSFPDVVQKSAFRQQSLTRAWALHKVPGQPPKDDGIIRRILDMRCAQIRGELKTLARGLVYTYDLGGLSRTAKSRKIAKLTSEIECELHYELIDEEGNGSGRKFSNPAIAELLIQVMFTGGRTSPGFRYMDLFSPISPNLIAILISAIRVALLEQAGSTRVNIDFKERDFGSFFFKVKSAIERYEASRRPRFEEIRTAILNTCRLEAGFFDHQEDSALVLHMSP